MPALFESGFFGNNQPFWHGLGTVIPEDVITMERVLELVPDLALSVEGKEIWANLGNGQGYKVPDHVAAVREDGVHLGVVGTGYQFVQNREAMSFLEEMLGNGKALAHTAGVLEGGKKSWIQCKRPENIRIAGLAEEEHEAFVTALNSFDGSTPVMTIVGTTRVGCANTYNAAIGNAKAKYVFKHTGSILDRVAAAKHVLGISHTYWDKYAAMGNSAIRVQFSDKQFMHTLDELVPLPSLTKLDYNPDDDRRREANAEKERDTLKLIWMDSPSNAHCRHTAWAAINTWTEWLDHHTVSRETTKSNQAENRMKRILFDTSLRAKATDMILEMAEVKV